MSATTIRSLYLDDVKFTDDGWGCYRSRATGHTNTPFYRFQVEVPLDQLERCRAEVTKYMDELYGREPFKFQYDPNDNSCYQAQVSIAYLRRYGKPPIINEHTGDVIPFRPRANVTSESSGLSLVYFKQLDQPRINGADSRYPENLTGRTGNIQYHLQHYDDGQVFAYAEYINLEPVDDDYVPSGKDDGGLF